MSKSTHERDIRIRAGIIPYAYDETKKIHFLFGKEYGGKWGPLAGTVEAGENIREGAIREFIEESMGLYSYADLAHIKNNAQVISIVDDKDSVKSYYYLLEVPWDPNIPYYFKNVTSLLVKCTGGKKNRWGVPSLGVCTEGLFEKSDLDWFDYADLKRKRNIFGYKGRKALDRLIEML